MEPIFTLPYPEHVIAEELNKYFPKKEGYSILIPLSRQQKGFDIILYNIKTKKVITIQVKSSRTYEGNPNKKRSKYPERKFYTWFNTFKIEKGSADCYILFGVYKKYPYMKKLDKSRKISKWYSHIFLIFNEEEMSKFLSEIKTKKGNKQDSKFSFGFDNEKEVFLTRGASNQPNISQFLFKNKLKEIKERINNGTS
ncbi:MAG: hypothetical protein AABW90_03480 [Nanoarchaeota archaeon]